MSCLHKALLDTDCLSAHSAIGKMIGLSYEQIVVELKGNGSDAKEIATLSFAERAAVGTKGKITEPTWPEIRSAGFSDGDIAEIIVLSS
jgi:cytochrome c551/c552